VLAEEPAHAISLTALDLIPMVYACGVRASAITVNITAERHQLTAPTGTHQQQQ